MKNVNSASRTSVRVRLAILSGLIVLPSIGYGLWWVSVQPKTYVVPPEPEAHEVAGLAFPQETDAETYRNAMREGHQRSIALLAKAIELAEAQVPVDQEAVAKLQAQLGERKLALGSVNGASK